MRVIVLNAFLIVLYCFPAFAQVLNTSIPFTASSPMLEPDGRKEILKISENEFVVLSKIKGGLTGDSEYSLEKYDGTLKNIFKVPFVVTTHEDIKELYFNGTELMIFSVMHNTDASESKLIAHTFNATSGAKGTDKILMDFKVPIYNVVRARGAVEETFENAVASGLSKNFVVPFQYQYDIQFSPDGSKFIAYIFDYSKPNLFASAAIFDKSLNKISEGTVPIDNNFVNYGIYVNNRGEVVILNVDKLGRIEVVQFNMTTKDNKLLDIQYSSTQRESLKIAFINDDEIFVGCVNTNQNKMVGVMYAKFNFAKNLVEKINFHDMSDGLVQTANAARASKNVKTTETWANYELTHFVVNKYEKVVMVLEKREINSTDYLYKSESVLEPDRWKERMAKVNTEGVLMFSFNSNDELMWENFYFKSQQADITSGLTNSSFIFYSNDEVIRIVYATSDNAAGIFNVMNYVEWDASNGNKVKELQLPNDEGLALVRNYSLWWDDKVIVAGRKGLIPKKYTLLSYKLNPGN
ncbi:MAG: hypothetical protein K2X86_04715 [Cytophagaceae bacterium]|nr:hypothetical protein [Cytophagaceae bacterium]